MTDSIENDVQQLADCCRAKLNLSEIKRNDDYGYRSLPLCVIDAIFSIGVRYSSTRNTVNRFVEYFKLTETLSIKDFLGLYQQHTIEFMAREVYQNSQRTSVRSGILKAEAVLKVAEVLAKHKINHLQDINAVINDPEFEADFMRIPGQKSGISLRYFYMLTGIETQIKPDRMIIRFIGNCIQRNVKADECVKLVVNACDLLKKDYPNLTPRNLDHAIWNYQRG